MFRERWTSCNRGQLYAQASESEALVGTAAFPSTLHSDLCFLAESNRDLVQPDNSASHSSRNVSVREGNWSRRLVNTFALTTPTRGRLSGPLRPIRSSRKSSDYVNVFSRQYSRPKFGDYENAFRVCTSFSGGNSHQRERAVQNLLFGSQNTGATIVVNRLATEPGHVVLQAAHVREQDE